MLWANLKRLQDTCVVGAQKNHCNERFLSGTKIICYDHDYNCIMTVLYYGQVAFIKNIVFYCIVLYLILLTYLFIFYSEKL